MLIFLIWMRKRLADKANTLDDDVNSPADYCVVAKNLKFKDYSNVAIEETIKNHFQSKYGIEGKDYQYSNPTYNIEDYYNVSSKYDALNKKEQLVLAYIKEKNISVEAYKTQMLDLDILPKDFPMEKKGLCSNPEPLDLETIRTEINEVKAEIEDMERKNDDSQEELENLFTGTVFVILNYESDAQKVINSSEKGILKRIAMLVLPCYFEEEDYWVWDRAPEPSDIQWENL